MAKKRGLFKKYIQFSPSQLAREEDSSGDTHTMQELFTKACLHLEMYFNRDSRAFGIRYYKRPPFPSPSIHFFSGLPFTNLICR